MRKKMELILGSVFIILGIGSMFMFFKLGSVITGIISFVFFGGVGAVIAFLNAQKLLEWKTARVHEFDSVGYIHAKDKSTHINTYSTSNSQNSVYSNQEYTTRVKTPIGFFDAKDKDAFMTYREGDKVKIHVKTRYDKNDKPFMSETRILDLLEAAKN